MGFAVNQIPSPANSVVGLSPTYISLFSGAGGMDVGFSMAGYRGMLAVDADKDALACLAHNTGTPIMVADLAVAYGHSLLPGGISPDLVLAGPPCQGFSTSGKRRLEDPRNDLLAQAVSLAVRLRPRVALIENVSGILSKDFVHLWEAADRKLRSHGYRTQTLRLQTADLGLPQRRKRVFLLGWLGDRNAELVLPAPNSRQVLADALSRGAVEPQTCLSPTAAAIARRIGEGQQLSDVRNGPRNIPSWAIPEVFGSTTVSEREVLQAVLKMRRRDRVRDHGDGDPVKVRRLSLELGRASAPDVRRLVDKRYLKRQPGGIEMARTYNGRFKRPSLASPSPTVDTKFTQARYFLHPTEDRAFSVREAARLQTFPETFQFTGRPRLDARLIGNAVPPALAKMIGLELLAQGFFS